MAPSPCELAEDLRPQTTKTLVTKTKGASPQLLSEWAASRVVNGAGAYAIVEMPTGDIYTVISVAQALRVERAAANMKAALEQLPGGLQVEWVRPLTRRLQTPAPPAKMWHGRASIATSRSWQRWCHRPRACSCARR